MDNQGNRNLLGRLRQHAESLRSRGEGYTEGDQEVRNDRKHKSGTRGKWKGPAMYTAIGVLAGSTLVSAPALASSGVLKAFTGKLYQNGQFVQNTPGFDYEGTSYFGVWYLQNLLRKDGIQSTWNGTSLQIQNAPVVQASSVTASTSSGQSLSSAADTITVNGVTYVPLSTVQQMLAQLSGNVHFGSSEQSSPSLSAVVEQLRGAIKDIYAYSSKTLAATSGWSGDHHGGDHSSQDGQNQGWNFGAYGSGTSGTSGSTVTLSSLLSGGNTQGEDLPGPAEGPGQNQAAFEALLHAGQRLQTAVQDLNAIQSALSGMSTGSTSGSTSGATSGSTSGTTSGSTSGTTSGSTSGTTSGSTSGTTSGSTTGSTSGTGSTSTELATLQTITTALQSDWTTLNSMELAVEASLGMSSTTTGTLTGSGSTGGSTTSGSTTGTGSTTTGSTTGGTTGSTTGGTTGSGTGSGTTTSTSTAADPTAIANLLADLQTQLQALQQLQALTSQDGSGHQGHDN